jgi:hypothetical protein
MSLLLAIATVRLNDMIGGRRLARVDGRLRELGLSGRRLRLSGSGYVCPGGGYLGGGYGYPGLAGGYAYVLPGGYVVVI